MTGVWLAPVKAEHRCRTPMLLPFHVRTGDRWKCTARLHEGELCGRTWRVVENANGRSWMWEDPNREEWKVFRPVTDEQLEYWLDHELGVPRDHPLERQKVVDAIKKHFEIGSRQ